jgi:hypothetical protein
VRISFQEAAPRQAFQLSEGSFVGFVPCFKRGAGTLSAGLEIEDERAIHGS